MVPRGVRVYPGGIFPNQGIIIRKVAIVINRIKPLIRTDIFKMLSLRRSALMPFMLHGKSKRHTRTPTPRYGHYLTHAHSHITGTRAVATAFSLPRRLNAEKCHSGRFSRVAVMFDESLAYKGVLDDLV